MTQRIGAEADCKMVNNVTYQDRCPSTKQIERTLIIDSRIMSALTHEN